MISFQKIEIQIQLQSISGANILSLHICESFRIILRALTLSSRRHIVSIAPFKLQENPMGGIFAIRERSDQTTLNNTRISTQLVSTK